MDRFKKINYSDGKNKKLRNIFKKEKIDGYLIPKNDEFFAKMLLIIMID